jgi:hypothetical protein
LDGEDGEGDVRRHPKRGVCCVWLFGRDSVMG